MSKRTFEEAFNAIFHDPNGYKEFCELDVASEVTRFSIDDRKLFRTTPKLKKYLRFIDRVVLRYLAKEEAVVHSFVKEKNTLTAVKAHAQNKFFLLTDIKDFYPNISSKDVTAIFKRDLDSIPISDFVDHIETVVGMTTIDNVLPVGFPTSPQLSNAFLFEFDKALQAFCLENRLVYTRYADDIIVSGGSFEELAEMSDLVQALLHEHSSANMHLNIKKTHITQLGNKVKILGLVIMPNGKVTIDSKHKNKIETLLHFYGTDKEKFASMLQTMGSDGERSLFGLLHYVRSIDPAYISKLQRKYGAYTVKSLMEERWSGQR